ncbi:MAG: hypothetical protein ACK4RT_06155 [Erythrobacter sp.]
MIALSRRRPASITAFAILFTVAAVLALIDALSRLSEILAAAQKLYPWVTRDMMIVWHSAWLTIALIPVAMVWLSAIRLARWLVGIAALIKLVMLLVGWQLLPRVAVEQPIWLAAAGLGLAAAAFLFTPASNRWFARRGTSDAAVFE